MEYCPKHEPGAGTDPLFGAMFCDQQYCQVRTFFGVVSHHGDLPRLWLMKLIVLERPRDSLNPSRFRQATKMLTG